MKPTVKRPYDSSRRRAEAQRLRLDILASARELFVRQGYGVTSLKQVAHEAGGSVETIYAAFGNKAELLRRVWYFAARGDDQEITLYDRPEMQAILSEADLAQRFRGLAEFTTAFSRRMSSLVVMLEGATASEPAAAEMLAEWSGRRLDVATRFAANASSTGQLAVPMAECRDILFATMYGDLWRQLVGVRRWSDNRYADWLGDLWVSQFVV
jgi:AcrR family transcriptional regulator